MSWVIFCDNILAHTTNISAGSILAKERKIGLINEISVSQKFWEQIGNSVESKSVYIKAELFKV